MNILSRYSIITEDKGDLSTYMKSHKWLVWKRKLGEMGIGEEKDLASYVTTDVTAYMTAYVTAYVSAYVIACVTAYVTA